MTSVLNWMGFEPRQRIGLRILQSAIGIMILFRCLTEFRFSAYLWGPHGVARGTNTHIFGAWLGGLIDSIFTSDLTVRLLLATLAGAALALVLGRGTRLAAGVAAASFMFFENRLPDVFDGGDNVTRLVLGYLVFAMSPRESWRPSTLRVWFHNLAVVSVAAQIMVLYICSGFMKASGEAWQQGTALYLISQVNTFSLPQFHEPLKHALLVTVMGYGTVFFQLWFPIAVMSRFKLLWLALGIGMHLGIAHMMGLVTFSTVMIGLELFLITDREFQDLSARCRRIGGLVLAWLARVRETRPALAVLSLLPLALLELLGLQQSSPGLAVAQREINLTTMDGRTNP